MQITEDRSAIPDKPYEISIYTIDVWQARISADRSNIKAHMDCLSFDEKTTADKFVRNFDRERYIYSHGLLRTILSGYVGCKPDQIRFEANRYGKPFISLPENGKKMQFSLSHSKDAVLIAVSDSRRVGIDVEFIRNMDDAAQIANRNFSQHERNYLFSLPPDEFNNGFFKCWTLKESFIKAIGQGLSYPLDAFSVSLSDPMTPSVIQFTDMSAQKGRWVSCLLCPHPGYAAALSVEWGFKNIRLRNYCE